MLTTIIIFAIVLSLLVFAHELGHFWVARKFGVRAEEFGFGFPPRIIGIQPLRRPKSFPPGQEAAAPTGDNATQGVGGTEPAAPAAGKQAAVRWKLIKGSAEPSYTSGEESMEKDTIYSINWIPMGGFVKIKGEDGDSEDDPDSFTARPIWQRALILSAGVIMNVLLAALLLSIGYLVGLPQSYDESLSPRAVIEDARIQIVEVLPGSPAEKAGVLAGDNIASIDGTEFRSQSALTEYVRTRAGVSLKYVFLRGDGRIEKEIVPEKLAGSDDTGIGVGITQTGIVRYPWYLAFWEGIKSTFALLWLIITAFYGLFKSLILGQGLAGADLAGPVRIAQLTGEVARMGLVYLLQFTAVLSINLAIINFFPLPALDGGRVLFLAIEKIKGRPIKRELEAALHNIFFTLLLILIALVTFRDIAKLDIISRLGKLFN